MKVFVCVLVGVDVGVRVSVGVCDGISVAFCVIDGVTVGKFTDGNAPMPAHGLPAARL